MPFAKLRTELLNARSRRQRLLQRNLPPHGASLLQLALNIPGAEKGISGTAGLFAWGLRQLQVQLPPVTQILVESDSLGPWGLFRSPLPALQAKSVTLQIEEGCDFARLLDIDVYDRSGHPCDRRRLGLPERSCLLCHLPAKECIRLQRHRPLQLKERLEELLKPFTT